VRGLDYLCADDAAASEKFLTMIKTIDISRG
jgi:hypothetical protein